MASPSPRERLTDLLADCHDDPDLFNSAILGRPAFWSRQREIGQSVVDYRTTVVYSGNSVGKDYVVGSLVPWWLYTRSHSLVIVTGPGQTTLGSVTWKEIRRATEADPDNPLGRVPLGMKLSQGVRASPLTATVSADWKALGYSTTSVERAAGQHNRKLLVIVEEGSGVEDYVWDAVDGLKYVRLLIIGNPIRAEGRFVDLIRQAERDRQDGIPRHQAVNAIRIRSTESPDVHLVESPRGLADKTWLEANYRQYGRDSLWVRSHIDAIIPDLSADRLIPDAWLDYAAACERPPLRPFDPVNATRRISCDLGEGVGRDSTSICVRDSLGILELITGSAIGLAEAATELARLAAKWGVDHSRISYDGAGIGRTFRNHLIRVGLDDAIGYFGSGRAKAPKAYTNLRTEAAWKLRQRLDPGFSTDPRFALATRQPPFSIPPRDWWFQLRAELEALTYDLVGNQTRLVKKEDLLDQLGRSPDKCDALIQSFAFD